MKDSAEVYIDNIQRRRISKDATKKEILWVFLEEDLELRNEIEHYLKDGYKINAIKRLKRYIDEGSIPVVPEWFVETEDYKESSLRELKDTIDRYAIRYNITKKLDQLRGRIEKWARKNGHDNIGYQKEVKDNKTGEYTYRYSDWEFIDDQYGLMINDWDWLPQPKTYKLYNKLWKRYIISNTYIKSKYKA